jgi:hypothetical protein
MTMGHLWATLTGSLPEMLPSFREGSKPNYLLNHAFWISSNVVCEPFPHANGTRHLAVRPPEMSLLTETSHTTRLYRLTIL